MNSNFEPQQVFNPPLEITLELISRAVAGETTDRRFYRYLLNAAPNEKERAIISGIREDELRHYELFRQIYRDITGRNPVPLGDDEFEEPENYLAGIEEAKLGEIETAAKYRQIYYGLRTREHRDKLFEIITDELRHADLYDYLYTRNFLNF
ncbi:ferritin family protein [Halothermothrix orenii]|uniref:Rubrerythrin n=1 Tax=Halothermothrix orenii (strain H 168 / OCM 544 / DSM 9562) TaxID=373903 RepID=B8D240_HALOH|nr:ferritin-like domain-containing protein [Halothermothrix orenii]ACL69267.1 Rubrerythrin [Halothermothrix orenii H 168]